MLQQSLVYYGFILVVSLMRKNRVWIDPMVLKGIYFILIVFLMALLALAFTLF